MGSASWSSASSCSTRATSSSTLALALVAEEQGLRVEGVARSERIPARDRLRRSSPARAGRRAPYGIVQRARRRSVAVPRNDGQADARLRPELAQLELALGVSVEDDVVPLFAGESGLYVRAGAPIREVTLVLSPDDPAKAGSRRSTRLLRRCRVRARATKTARRSSPRSRRRSPIAGVAAKTAPDRRGRHAHYAIVDDHIARHDGEQGIADVAEGGPTLADNPVFDEARETAGTPDETLGFVYLDLNDGLRCSRGSTRSTTPIRSRSRTCSRSSTSFSARPGAGTRRASPASSESARPKLRRRGARRGRPRHARRLPARRRRSGRRADRPRAARFAPRPPCRARALRRRTSAAAGPSCSASRTIVARAPGSRSASAVSSRFSACSTAGRPASRAGSGRGCRAAPSIRSIMSSRERVGELVGLLVRLAAPCSPGSRSGTARSGDGGG